MKRKINSIVIFVFCLFVGLVIIIQINKAQRFGETGLISINEAAIYEEELQKVQADKELSMQELLKNERDIERFEKDQSSKDVYLRSIMNDIEKYKMSAGLYDVEGPGITITINDPVFIDNSAIIDGYNAETESEIMHNCELLISLVNYLKKIGAEAISVNGQRIIATTEFNYTGNKVYINKVPTAPPYIVKAIGDPDAIESLLDIRYGIIDVMRNQHNLQVDIEKDKLVQIPRYLDDLKFKYAKPLEKM